MPDSVDDQSTPLARSAPRDAPVWEQFSVNIQGKSLQNGRAIVAEDPQAALIRSAVHSPSSGNRRATG